MGTMEALTAALEANTKALEANTAALGAAPAAAPAKPATRAAAKPKDEVKSKYTAEQVRDKFIALKDATDEDTAKATIEAQGVKKLAELVADPSKWDAAYAAAEEAIAAAEQGGDEDGGL